MKAHKYKKNVKTIEQPIDCSLENAIENFVRAITTEEQSHFHAAFESFEMYQKRLSCAVHNDCDIFQQSFLNGYKVLLEELRKNNQ